MNADLVIDSMLGTRVETRWLVDLALRQVIVCRDRRSGSSEEPSVQIQGDRPC